MQLRRGLRDDEVLSVWLRGDGDAEQLEGSPLEGVFFEYCPKLCQKASRKLP